MHANVTKHGKLRQTQCRLRAPLWGTSARISARTLYLQKLDWSTFCCW